MNDAGWHGFDLDRTLAFYDTWRGEDHIGPPIQPMVDRVKAFLAAGEEVRIVTARGKKSRRAVEAWCLLHIGAVLPITTEKDYAMLDLYDDRAKQVEGNTGLLLEDRYVVMERDLRATIATLDHVIADLMADRRSSDKFVIALSTRRRVLRESLGEVG